MLLLPVFINHQVDVPFSFVPKKSKIEKQSFGSGEKKANEKKKLLLT